MLRRSVASVPGRYSQLQSFSQERQQRFGGTELFSLVFFRKESRSRLNFRLQARRFGIDHIELSIQFSVTDTTAPEQAKHCARVPPVFSLAKLDLTSLSRSACRSSRSPLLKRHPLPQLYPGPRRDCGERLRYPPRRAVPHIRRSGFSKGTSFPKVRIDPWRIAAHCNGSSGRPAHQSLFPNRLDHTGRI